MRKSLHAPSFAIEENVRSLPDRDSAYWNILEYCRHIGVRKRPNGTKNWLARVRTKKGTYLQTILGPIGIYQGGGMNYEQAVQAARDWFDLPEVAAIASDAYQVGSITTLKYTKKVEGFTVGDALADYVEWKRISAANTYFQTSLSLINHHIVPKLGDVLVEDFTGKDFTKFCLDVLESQPKRGKQKQGGRIPLENIGHDALRKRKKTLNALVAILRLTFRMAWENGLTESDRAWRCLRRVPNAEIPRQYFLTRNQAKRLLSACRPDLAKLVLAALYTGCRVSELTQLRVRDVGIHVFGIYVAPMKSYRGRYVYLPDEGMSFFLDQCEGKDEDELVFRMSSGKQWQGSHKHLFREAVDKAGLPKGFVFHGLRHTYASQLVQAGTALAIVAAQLGHSNTDSVSRTYGHLSCTSIESELARRFASLCPRRHDARLSGVRNSLQAKPKEEHSWPVRNYNRASGDLIARLRSVDSA